MHPFRGISKNPRSNIVEIGNREIVTQGLNSGFWTDLYHRSMSVSWPVFFASAALVFIALNGTFALVFLLGDEPIAANVPTGNFMDMFYFSIETFYSHDDIAWQHRYVDIMTVMADGRLFIDYAGFHDVTPDSVSANAGDARPDASPEDLAQPR
jgi:hypothetical protein